MTAIPDTMKAAFVSQLGGPEQIEYGTLATPQPGPNEALVRLVASEVNHVDLLVRSGGYHTETPLPFIIGRDIVGDVVAVGPEVTGLRVGDRVWGNSQGHHGRQGTFAEYSAITEERLHRLPAGVDPVEAAAVLHGAGTAHLGLVREAHLKSAETIFIGGAGGAVGGAAL